MEESSMTKEHSLVLTVSGPYLMDDDGSQGTRVCTWVEVWVTPVTQHIWSVGVEENLVRRGVEGSRVSRFAGPLEEERTNEQRPQPLCDVQISHSGHLLSTVKPDTEYPYRKNVRLKVSYPWKGICYNIPHQSNGPTTWNRHIT